MEETTQGLAAAASARALTTNLKKRELDHSILPPNKRGAPPPTPTEQHQQEPQPPSPPPCTHEVAIPEGYNISQSNPLDPSTYGTINHPKYTGKMVKSYPFSLDPFQSTAIACIERNESVLVAAHTSAGKTVVAEYAIAKSIQAGQRVVYTSPIKALSNQKYQELSAEFEDVGIMTGDVVLNPNASCVVMTTEIFRSMMYKGSEMLREVAWVIFDEVHYMQDRERGVVWEETLIFLPKGARAAFLSATLPNAFEFAQWVAYIHTSPCHVVYTDYRPVPLVHYAYPIGSNGGLHRIMDAGKGFRGENFKKLRMSFPNARRNKEKEEEEEEEEKERKRDNGSGSGNGGTRVRDKYNNNKKPGNNDSAKKGQSTPRGPGPVNIGAELQKILTLIKDMNWEPAVIFSFSRNDCETYAMQACYKAKLDFNTEEEKQRVRTIWNAAMLCLSEEDRQLTQVTKMLPLLEAGVGIHHGGLLPIVKEVTEILFQDSAIKCLFATETFAMGINMPARTVIFTTLKKWDGTDNRWVSSGEYIQMSGRAGRRGLDDKGVVIAMVDESLDAETCKSLMSGGAKSLMSSFRLSYYTLLNLMRRAEDDSRKIDYVISRSFSQFQHENELPRLEGRLREIEEEVKTKKKNNDNGDNNGDDEMKAVEEWALLTPKLAAAKEIVTREIAKPHICLKFLRPGRIIKLSSSSSFSKGKTIGKGQDWGYGVVVTVLETNKKGSSSSYIVDTLVCCEGGSVKNGAAVPGKLEDNGSEMHVIAAPLHMLQAISTLRIALPNDLREGAHRKSVLLTLKELVSKYRQQQGGRNKNGQYGDLELPAMDPLVDLKITDAHVIAAHEEVKSLTATLQKNPLWGRPQSSGGNGGDGKDGGGGEEEDPLMQALRKKAEMLAEADAIRKRMKASQLTSFKEESKVRLAVLKKLGHVGASDGLITKKGQAACEITAGDEVLATELMFDAAFNSLDIHQLAAVVSCLVPVEKSNSEVHLTRQLAAPLLMLQQCAKRIAEVSQECGLTDVDTEVYIQSFRPTLMDAIHAWSKGASFSEVMQTTDLYEGSVIRAARRLFELLVEMEEAARSVGDETLAEKFGASKETIKRGIVFAASLFL